MPQKLNLHDLTCVNGGQIYEFFDKEKKIHYYLVPSAAGYKICHNKTEALDQTNPLAKKGIIPCGSLEVAQRLAKKDSDFYWIVEALNK